MERMLRGALMGTAAGAVGTVALNATTYADMALRGRPASSVPARVAGTLAERVSVDLGSDETRQNRKSGLGALSGYVVGLGVGTAYGLVRPHLGRVSKMRAGVVLGLGAMAGSDVPAAATGFHWGRASRWSQYALLAAAVTVVFTMMTMGYARETARRAGNEDGGWLIRGCLTLEERFVGEGCPSAPRETP